MVGIGRRRKWRPEEIAEIRGRYQSEDVYVLATRFGVTTAQLAAIAYYHGIHKTWKMKKVKSEPSTLDPIALMESRFRIKQLILESTDIGKAKKLEAIYKSMNEAINKSL